MIKTHCVAQNRLAVASLLVVIAMAKGKGKRRNTDLQHKRHVRAKEQAQGQGDVRGRSPDQSAGHLGRSKGVSKHKTEHKAKVKKRNKFTKRFRVLPSNVPVLLSIVSRMMSCLSKGEKDKLSLHKQFMNGRLHTSSSCSGSGLPRVVEHYIGQKMKVKISHVFACEKEPWKQRWNHKVVGKFSGDSEAQHTPCMHPDIGGLCGTKCACVEHDGQCHVRKSRVHSSGFSCKDMSKMHKDRGGAGRNCLANQTGTSGNTLAGLVSYCKSHRPEIVVLENVDDLLSATSPNYTYLMKEFRALGYVGDAADVMSTQYYCPQRRRRAYLIFYLCPAASDPDTIVAEHLNPAIALAKRLGSSLEENADGSKTYVGPPLGRFFLSDKHPYLQNEFKRLGEHREKSGDSLAEARKKKGEAGVEDDPWKETNRNTLAKMGVAVSECVVPLSERGTVGYNLLTSREKMVLGHALLACPQLHNADIYQSLGREFLSDVPVLSTIVPGSMKWIRPLKRLLLGYEALKVQGMPDDLMKLAVQENYSDNSMMDLAGNSFTGMVYCAFLISALVHAPLPTSGDKAGQSTNEIAASVLDICSL